MPGWGSRTQLTPSRVAFWDAGTLTLLAPVSAFRNCGSAVLNDRGRVSGASCEAEAERPLAMLWHVRKAYDLNRLIPRPRWRLLRATGNNNRGQIVGVVTLKGWDVAFPLTPFRGAAAGEPKWR